MKTVITESVNGFDIVIGFGIPAIDPKESQIKLNPMLAVSSEMQAVTAKRQEIETRMTLAADSKKAAQLAQTQPDRDLKNAEYRNHVSIAETMVNDELIPLNNTLETYKRSLWDSSEVVHFEPKQGEFIKTDAEVEALKVKYSTKGIGKALTLAGTLIDDLRGVKYWTSDAGVWSPFTVVNVDEVLPAGATIEADLTEAQRILIAGQIEDERITGLTQSEKDAEKAIAIANATNYSVNLRSQYEIQGSTPSVALADAQTWLTAEMVEIEAKYA